MIVTFLGTGTSQGVPVIACKCGVCSSMDFRDKRLRTSVHIQSKGKSIVIDTGPDFRQQMLRERISRVDAILFTHEHKDHTAGLDDVRAFNFFQKEEMPVYGRPSVMEQLRQEYHYAFADKKYPGVPRLNTCELDGSPFNIGDVYITPVEVKHMHLPVYGFRIEEFTYITDANSIGADEMKKIHGSKTLVINALQQQDHISHFNLQEALEVIDEVRPEKAWLIHLSHRMGKHSEVEKLLPDNVNIAYDGLTLEI